MNQYNSFLCNVQFHFESRIPTQTLFDIYVWLTGCFCGFTWPELFLTSLHSYFNQVFVSQFSFFSFSQRISSIFCDIHFDILVLPAGGVFPLFLCSSAGMLFSRSVLGDHQQWHHHHIHHQHHNHQYILFSPLRCDGSG